MPLKEYQNKSLFGEHKLFPRTPLREWIRKHIPGPQEGFVAEDLDLIFLRYGKLIGRDKDADGQFILCEWKLSHRELPYSQQRVFGLIDRLLRKADPESVYYQGFYSICWNGEDKSVIINDNRFSLEEFQTFLLGEKTIEPNVSLNERRR